MQGYPGLVEAVEQPKMVGWVQPLGCRRGGGPPGRVEETGGGVGLNQWQGVAALLEQGQELAFKRTERGVRTEVAGAVPGLREAHGALDVLIEGGQLLGGNPQLLVATVAHGPHGEA